MFWQERMRGDTQQYGEGVQVMVVFGEEVNEGKLN